MDRQFSSFRNSTVEVFIFWGGSLFFFDTVPRHLMFVLRFETAWCRSGVAGPVKNHLCQQSAMEKNLILLICRADERVAEYCGVSATTVKGKGMRELNRNRMHAPVMESRRRPGRISDDFDLLVIRCAALESHDKKKGFPLCTLVL